MSARVKSMDLSASGRPRLQLPVQPQPVHNLPVPGQAGPVVEAVGRDTRHSDRSAFRRESRVVPGMGGAPESCGDDRIALRQQRRGGLLETSQVASHRRHEPAGAVTRPRRDLLAGSARRAPSTTRVRAAEDPPRCTASQSQCGGRRVTSRAATPRLGRPVLRSTGLASEAGPPGSTTSPLTSSKTRTAPSRLAPATHEAASATSVHALCRRRCSP